MGEFSVGVGVGVKSWSWRRTRTKTRTRTKSRSSRKAPSENYISYPHLHSRANSGGGLCNFPVAGKRFSCAPFSILLWGVNDSPVPPSAADCEVVRTDFWTSPRLFLSVDRFLKTMRAIIPNRRFRAKTARQFGYPPHFSQSATHLP